MARPNLFDYATHELSQDAFLIWLIRYADKNFQEDAQLHAIAQKFLQKILNRPNLTIDTVECWKQWENIDITAKINEIGNNTVRTQYRKPNQSRIRPQ